MKIKNRFLLLVLVLLAINPISAQSSDDKYQEILDKAHKNGLPAIVVSVKPANESAWIGKAGVSNLESSSPLDIDQSFRLASISKIFTSVVVFQLMDEDRIVLSDPISKFIDPSILRKIPYADEITILQLLSHSSGIYSFTENNSFWKECYLNGGMSRIWQPHELISYVENKKPIHKPMAPYSEKYYSNTNYILLGMIIEKATGNSLLNEYQNRIFKPLRMDHTFLEGYDNQDRKPIESYAVPNTFFLKSAMKKKDIKKVGNSELINLSKEYNLFNSWAWAAGGISSNVSDLSIFLSALRKGELLNEETQKVLMQLNSSVDNGITFFGGTGGSDGIQATMLHIMPSDIDIIILINSTGSKEVNLSSVFIELYKRATN